MSGSPLSLWPPSNQQIAPADPPVSTAPRSAAEAKRSAKPIAFQRSTACKVLPPLTTSTSAADVFAAISSIVQSPVEEHFRLSMMQPAAAKLWVCASLNFSRSYVAVPMYKTVVCSGGLPTSRRTASHTSGSCMPSFPDPAKTPLIPPFASCGVAARAAIRGAVHRVHSTMRKLELLVVALSMRRIEPRNRAVKIPCGGDFGIPLLDYYYTLRRPSNSTHKTRPPFATAFRAPLLLLAREAPRHSCTVIPR